MKTISPLARFRETDIDEGLTLLSSLAINEIKKLSALSIAGGSTPLPEVHARTIASMSSVLVKLKELQLASANGTHLDPTILVKAIDLVKNANKIARAA